MNLKHPDYSVVKDGIPVSRRGFGFIYSLDAIVTMIVSEITVLAVPRIIEINESTQ